MRSERVESSGSVSRQPKHRDLIEPRAARWTRLAAGLVLLCALLAAYLVLSQTGVLDSVTESDVLERTVVRLGPIGPALLVGLMTLAIVMSPIPSAPIALAAGAAYGHFWGTLYVALGAEAGALIAFGLARLVGYGVLRTWLSTHRSAAILDRFMHSQNALTAAVFVTRLLPFLSFDVISYAAGLTPLRTWRFALATLMGILPASFLLAHFGEEAASGDLRRVGLTVLVLGSVTLLPFAWKAVPHRYRSALKRRVNFRERHR